MEDFDKKVIEEIESVLAKLEPVERDLTNALIKYITEAVHQSLKKSDLLNDRGILVTKCVFYTLLRISVAAE